MPWGAEPGELGDGRAGGAPRWEAAVMLAPPERASQTGVSRGLGAFQWWLRGREQRWFVSGPG